MSAKHSEDISKLSSNEIKSKIQREGIWPQYTQRIKSLERTEQEFWKLFGIETDSARKRTILEDLVNLQPVIANCYDAAQKMLMPNMDLKN
ncbi:hypothetical protein SCCGRSA3_01037 [Marine Group I thaumarchaeote SCGC RSA3]|uniref:Uncharacterized protein n=2 Tax=Marine Group I TaxID=905826 RepID=A0A087RT47_9ARCH|nr:hypothetical protein AAA799D11_00594 [Marine Group I thaumarchaeote SCGC AAA799-D11]KFM18704.1 hypothetical protein SCCGRSA3_01037 [Marine Group I thaumarchaeote SCGC RSA3]